MIISNNDNMPRVQFGFPPPAPVFVDFKDQKQDTNFFDLIRDDQRFMLAMLILDAFEMGRNAEIMHSEVKTICAAYEFADRIFETMEA